MPLVALEAVEASTKTGIDKIYSLIASKLEEAKPRADLNAIIAEIKQFESDYAPRLLRMTKDEDSGEQSALGRMKDGLKDTRYTWRSIESLASKAGVTESEALDILRGDPEIELGRGKTGSYYRANYSRSQSCSIGISQMFR